MRGSLRGEGEDEGRGSRVWETRGVGRGELLVDAGEVGWEHGIVEGVRGTTEGAWSYLSAREDAGSRGLVQVGGRTKPGCGRCQFRLNRSRDVYFYTTIHPVSLAC